MQELNRGLFQKPELKNRGISNSRNIAVQIPQQIQRKVLSVLPASLRLLTAATGLEAGELDAVLANLRRQKKVGFRECSLTGAQIVVDRRPSQTVARDAKTPNFAGVSQ